MVGRSTSRHPKLRKEESSGSEVPQFKRKEKKNTFSNQGDSLTIKAAPFQTPFSIVSYLNNGPTISCKCGFVFATLRLYDLSTAVIDEIECKCELDPYGGVYGSESAFCGGK